MYKATFAENIFIRMRNYKNNNLQMNQMVHHSFIQMTILFKREEVIRRSWRLRS